MQFCHFPGTVTCQIEDIADVKTDFFNCRIELQLFFTHFTFAGNFLKWSQNSQSHLRMTIIKHWKLLTLFILHTWSQDMLGAEGSSPAQLSSGLSPGQTLAHLLELQAELLFCFVFFTWNTIFIWKNGWQTMFIQNCFFDKRFLESEWNEAV